MSQTYELVLPAEFDARGEYEAEQRGLLDHVKVRLAGGATYSLCFFTPSRIEVELNLIRDAGEPCMADPGMVVVPSVTRDEMSKAVQFLGAAGYFERLRPDA
jgi:16S rRNA C1402 (ribose-2'-O) methylase RsmI